MLRPLGFDLLFIFEGGGRLEHIAQKCVRFWGKAMRKNKE